MEMIIDFPGGSRVDAQFGNFTVGTDQPPVAGAPTPFALFLSSIGTCAGIYVLGFCRQRGISTDGIKLTQQMQVDPASGMVTQIQLDIYLPPSFPEKYKPAVIRSAEQCKVKKHLEHPPVFEVSTVTDEPIPA